MYLNTATDVIRVVLGAAHTTNALRVVSFSKVLTTATSRLTSLVPEAVQTNGTTPVVVAAAPAAGTNKEVTQLHIQNADTVAHTVQIQFFNGTTAYNLQTLDARPGDTITYHKGTWRVYNDDGILVETSDRAAVLSLIDEVTTARGDRSALNLRISTISNFASPNAGGVIAGNFYDASFQGTASATLALAANRVDMSPFYTSVPLTIDQIGVAVSTQVASSLARCFIYEADADGWPDTLLYEGPSDLDCSTQGYKFHVPAFTFDSGRQYWLGVKSSSTQTIRAINVSSAVNLGLGTSSTATSYATIIRRTLTFADPMPANWGFTSTDLVANVAPPSIRMRAAVV